MRLLPYIALLFSHLAIAQVTGVFSLDKSVYSRGEPVLLNLTLTNQSEQAQEVKTADPYSFCSGYQIEIARQGASRLSCFTGYGGSCPSGVITIAPHAARTERILLNYQNTSRGDLNPPVKLPGAYTVDARRDLIFAPAGSGTLGTSPQEEIHQVLSLRIDDADGVPSAVFAPFVQQLSSPDFSERRGAARALATLAPSALEPLLLSFATSEDVVLREEAPAALANLATPKSLDALAKMLQIAPSGSYESFSAARYLGRTHDPKWLPQLLEAADENHGMHLDSAAESGGDAALPQLLIRLRSPNSLVRSSAISALGSTGSRAAVPLLLGILGSASARSGQDATDEADSALVALQQLTHRYIQRDQSSTWVQAAYPRWQAWWTASGREAKIYFPEDCAEDIPLP